MATIPEISAGTGGSDTALLAGSPTKMTDFDKTLTALIRKDLLENLRDVARWLVPGSFVKGKLVKGTNLIRHVAFADLDEQESLVDTEGEPPDAEGMKLGWMEYAVKQRARLLGVTDVAMALSPFELMSIAAEKVSYDAKMTVDRSIAAAVMAGTGITLALAGAKVAAADVRKWATQLKIANVPTFPDGFYIAMINPAITYDLMSDTSIGGWIEASKYADPSRLLNGEIGRMYGVRFVESNVGTVTPGATDTYNTVVFGPEYFAFGDLQSIESYIVRPGGDHSDPLAQKALVGYKGMWGAKTIEVAEAGGPRFGKVESHAGTDFTA